MAFQTTVTTLASLLTPLAVEVQSTFPIVIVARLIAVVFVTFQTTITLVASLVTRLAVAFQSIFPIVIVARLHKIVLVEILLAVCAVTFCITFTVACPLTVLRVVANKDST